MSVIASFVQFLEMNTKSAYLILFLGAYFETLIGPGFFIYGEIFFLGGAIIAGLGYLNIWLVALFCILGGLLGDSSSYFIGWKYGHHAVRLLFKKDNKYLNYKNYKKAERFFHKKGKRGIFFARLMGPLSWVTPFIAGTLKVKYKDFAKYNFPAVFVGIGLFLIAGYFFGYSYNLFLGQAQKYLWYIILVFLFISIIYLEKNFSLFSSAGKHIVRKLKG